MVQTKAALGGMRFQLLPNGVDPSKAACGHRKMRHLQLSEGLIVSATPAKEPTLGVPTVGDLGVSSWPPGHSHGPAHSPEGASGLLREPRDTLLGGEVLSCLLVPGLPSVW